MKKITLWLRRFSASMREARYAPLLLLLFVVLIWVFPSYQSPPQPKTITITVTVEDAQIILSALGKEPYEKVERVIVSIVQQANRQLNPEPPQKADSSKPKKQ